MSPEQVNVERKLGRGQVVSLAHERKLHIASLATLPTAERDLFRLRFTPRVRFTPDGTVNFRSVAADSCPKQPTKTG